MDSSSVMHYTRFYPPTEWWKSLQPDLDFARSQARRPIVNIAKKNSQMPRHLISGWEIWMSHNSYDYALAKSLTIKKLYFHRDEVTRTLFSGNSEVYVQPFSIQINLEIPMTKSASRALQSFVR